MGAAWVERAGGGRVVAGGSLCALSMGLNLVWCTLMGHTAGFARLAEDAVLSSAVNPRLFFLLGVLAFAAVCAAFPGFVRHGDGVLRFVFPLVGAVGTACFALLSDPVLSLPVPVALCGLFATGVVYFWIVARCILMLARTRGVGTVVACLTGAVVVRLAVTQTVCSVNNPELHVACAVVAPVAAALAFELACAFLRRAAREEAMGLAGEPGAGAASAPVPSGARTVFGIPQRACVRGLTSRADFFSMYLLVFIGAVVLAVARSISMFGVWGDTGTSISPVAPWLLGVVVPVLVVGAFAYFALVRMGGYSLVARFQPALLLALVGLFVAVVLSSPDAEELSGLSLAVQIGESWAHLLFWTIVATSLDVLGLPSYRAIGVGGVTYAALSILWLLFLSQQGMMATLVAVLAAYILVIGMLCVAWNPLRSRVRAGGATAGMAGAPETGSAGAGGAVREVGGTAGGGAVRGTEDVAAGGSAVVGMFDRCAELAERYALSPRETEVFVLMAQGRSRSFIQEELVLSGSTVKTHATHIYAKMGVQGRQELMDLIWRERVTGA